MANANNNITLWGRLTADATRHLNNDGDNCYYKMDIAVNLTKDIVDFIPVICYGARWDNLGPYLKKGTALIVNGTLRTSSYTRSDGSKARSFSVAADNIKLTGGDRKIAPVESKQQGHDDDNFMPTTDATLPF